MDITGFLNQTATFEKYLAHNDWGDPTYAPPIEIPARITQKRKLHRFTNQDSMISVGNVLTNAVEVSLQDRINGEELLAVENYVDITGEVIGYTAFPRPPVGYAN